MTKTRVFEESVDWAKPSPGNQFRLTARELEITALIVEGCTNKDIARECSIAEETVKRHLKNIFAKAGVSSRLELAMLALNHKLIRNFALSALRR